MHCIKNVMNFFSQIYSIVFFKNKMFNFRNIDISDPYNFSWTHELNNIKQFILSKGIQFLDRNANRTE